MCRDVDFVSRQWHSSVRLESVTSEFPSIEIGLAVWWSIMCCDMIFGVTTAALRWEAGVYHDRTFSVATGPG